MRTKAVAVQSTRIQDHLLGGETFQENRWESRTRSGYPSNAYTKFRSILDRFLIQFLRGSGTARANAIETGQIPAQILPCESIDLLLTN